ncbi:Hypothetical_protein [Hexamita inflata]|uniref:Hypothetical_protein n=1 Tax=Hexamita inflata TaxID=28002 RepID=A0AA86QHH6_9EUKA|nr:Hypothetical protein HINF_LOCUS44042 [Hexamita inflata]CAI9956407.1 Hypothetical protein HINF_LOCUS44052 [Hexamita inflata]
MRQGQTRTYVIQKRQTTCAYPISPSLSLSCPWYSLPSEPYPSLPRSPSPARGIPYPLSPPSTSCPLLFCPRFRKVCLQGVQIFYNYKSTMDYSYVKVVKGFMTRDYETFPTNGINLPKDNNYCQILDGMKSSTFYCDIDNQDANIEEQINILIKAFGKRNFYVVKNNIFNKYHVFCHSLIFQDLFSIKCALCNLKGCLADLAVYSKTSQLFRMINQTKNFDKSKGVYNILYEYSDNKLNLLEGYYNWVFLIHQGYKPNVIVELKQQKQPFKQLTYHEGSDSEEEEAVADQKINIDQLRERVIREDMNSSDNTYDKRRRFAYCVYMFVKQNKQQCVEIIKTFVDEGIFKPTFGKIDYITFINNFQ